MAEQVGGGEAGALALGPRVLEEDGGAAGRGASERSADHAPLERAQLRSAAAERQKRRWSKNSGGQDTTCPRNLGLEAEKTR